MGFLSQQAVVLLLVHAVINIESTKDGVTFNACLPVDDVTEERPGLYRAGYNNGAPASYVIQRRMNGNIPFQNRTWAGYSYLLGDPKGDCWLGLHNVYQLTSQGYNVLTIRMKDWKGNSKVARYGHFKLLDSQNYTLSIGQFSGNVKDDMSYSNGQPFATQDRPDKYNCAINQGTGWWYQFCSKALLNGHYYIGGYYTPTGGWYDGIYWNDWLGSNYSLKFVEMSISKK